MKGEEQRLKTTDIINQKFYNNLCTPKEIENKNSFEKVLLTFDASQLPPQEFFCVICFFT